jgi:NADH-quinone oxidoreductase subunit E
MSVLTDDLRQRILAYLPRYPSKQAVTLPALHLVQDTLRCVPLEAIREIADLLDLSPAEVHDTMSFYGFFRSRENPLGQTRLWVCRSLACALHGGDALLRDVCHKLKVQPGGTSADGTITVEFAECIGVCEGAPAVLIDDAYRLNVTPDKVDGLLEEVRNRRAAERPRPSALVPPAPRGNGHGENLF